MPDALAGPPPEPSAHAVERVRCLLALASETEIMVHRSEARGHL
jgi:hypothetical protein